MSEKRRKCVLCSKVRRAVWTHYYSGKYMCDPCHDILLAQMRNTPNWKRVAPTKGDKRKSATGPGCRLFAFELLFRDPSGYETWLPTRTWEEQSLPGLKTQNAKMNYRIRELEGDERKHADINRWPIGSEEHCVAMNYE